MDRDVVSQSISRGTPLSRLQTPLAYFGLGLTVMEGAFGIFLASRAYSEKVIVLIVCWMGLLFLTNLIVVAFLTYRVPHHIMLQAQTEMNEDALHVVRLTAEAMRLLADSATNPSKDPKEVLTVLNHVETILKDRK